jgi:hypothetical protein
MMGCAKNKLGGSLTYILLAGWQPQQFKIPGEGGVSSTGVSSAAPSYSPEGKTRAGEGVLLFKSSEAGRERD